MCLHFIIYIFCNPVFHLALCRLVYAAGERRMKRQLWMLMNKTWLLIPVCWADTEIVPHVKSFHEKFYIEVTIWRKESWVSPPFLILLSIIFQSFSVPFHFFLFNWPFLFICHHCVPLNSTVVVFSTIFLPCPLSLRRNNCSVWFITSCPAVESLVSKENRIFPLNHGRKAGKQLGKSRSYAGLWWIWSRIPVGLHLLKCVCGYVQMGETSLSGPQRKQTERGFKGAHSLRSQPYLIRLSSDTDWAVWGGSNLMFQSWNVFSFKLNIIITAS